MNNLRSILYISLGTTTDTEGLKQTLSITRNNNAALTILIITPDFPESMTDYSKNVIEMTRTQVKAHVEGVMDILDIPHNSLAITYTVEACKNPAAAIIRHAIENKHDIVMKDAQCQVNDKGFKALDMDLLRKCPTPVWLCRPITQARNDIRVAVAIDPETTGQNELELSAALLQLARTLADTANGTLQVISCWHLPHEKALRESPLLNIPTEETDRQVALRKAEHEAALAHVLQHSGISGDIQVLHLNGQPETTIPNAVAAENIDILVMGTVARSGVTGFIMGNTVENILQELECSLLAMKPADFSCPA